VDFTVVRAERVLEVGLLLLAPMRLWWFVCLSPFRRQFPAKAYTVAAGLCLYSAFIVAIALLEPWVLRPLAILAGCSLMFVWWRSRANYGGNRRWPPGRLKLLPSKPYSDPDYYRAEAERYGPVFKTGATHPYPTLRPVACIVSHELGLEVLRRNDESLKLRPEFPFSRFIPRGFLRHMKPNDHGEYSKLFHAAMRQSNTGHSAEFLAAIIRKTLCGLADACAQPDVKGLRPDGYLNDMMLGILSAAFFGIVPGSAEFTRLKALHGALNFRRITRRTMALQIETRRAALMAFLIEWARHIGGREAENSVAGTCVLAAIHRIDKSKVDDPTVIGNLAYMLEISRNDVAGLLLWLMKMLCDHPDWLDELRKGPAVLPARGSLADRIVSETLRLEQSEYLYRHTTETIEVADYVIPKGWVLRICIRDAHRSSAVFLKPGAFDPDRFDGKDYPLTSYAPFGLFRHICIGADLTMMIGRIFVHELARGFTLQATDDGPPEHPRYHWEPSSRFHIHLEPRTRDRRLGQVDSSGLGMTI